MAISFFKKFWNEMILLAKFNVLINRCGWYFHSAVPHPQKKILMSLNVLQFSKFYMPSKVVTKETPAHFFPVNFSNLLDHLSIEVICPTICYNLVNGLILKAFKSSSYLRRVLFLGDLWNIKRDNNAKISKVSYLQKSSFSIVPKVS